MLFIKNQKQLLLVYCRFHSVQATSRLVTFNSSKILYTTGNPQGRILHGAAQDWTRASIGVQLLDIGIVHQYVDWATDDLLLYSNSYIYIACDSDTICFRVWYGIRTSLTFTPNTQRSVVEFTRVIVHVQRLERTCEHLSQVRENLWK